MGFRGEVGDDALTTVDRCPNSKLTGRGAASRRRYLFAIFLLCECLWTYNPALSSSKTGGTITGILSLTVMVVVCESAKGSRRPFRSTCDSSRAPQSIQMNTQQLRLRAAPLYRQLSRLLMSCVLVCARGPRMNCGSADSL